ncbi:leucyl aminopeptidase [Halobacillus salinarum]|uniref:Probable cytosol aminopeptidase n=1 Tax=Halobacillus salinarum TaxID=2932257 RepID=A0ABY4ENM6_9BACI|nr:leucyl aminopeptidase [Halobacillus salinarum]UOQ46058.1 leucyl aminopeptidase [Halobacillus salinarum]
MYEIRKNVMDQDQALIVGIFSENKLNQTIFDELDEKFNGLLAEYIKAGDISTNYKEISKVMSFGNIPAKQIYFLGFGQAGKLDRNRFRRAYGALFKQLQKDGVTRPAVSLMNVESVIPAEECAEVMAEALTTATYTLKHFKTDNRKNAEKIESVALICSEEANRVLSAAEKGRAIGEGINSARHLVHLPANMLTPSEMAEYAKTIAADYGMEIEVIDKSQMENMGMGALLAVNQGSAEPPKVIVLKYQGLPEWSNVTAFVGKGITYDTGGYSIKSKTGMPGMKGDMGGAAAVLGAMETIGRLKPKQNVLAVIPSSDNMISGSAFKPDDVITSLSGKTIEVLNTDAEGRLALADGITLAKQRKASRLIDVATLTGGVVTALGSWMTGAMTNHEEFFKELQKMGEFMGEPIWQLPYNDDYKAQVRKSNIADLNNSPTRKAHPIMGGAFIGEFAGETPWIHLDIAGTSEADSPHDLGPKGPTGVMAKTLAAYILK